MLTQRPWVPIPLKSRNVFQVYSQLLKLQLPLRWSYPHLKFVFLQFTSSTRIWGSLQGQSAHSGLKENNFFFSDTPSFDITHLLQVAFTIKVLSGWFDRTTHAYLYMAASLQSCQQFIHWYIDTEFCSIFKVISKFLCKAKCFGCPLPSLIEQMLKSSACLQNLASVKEETRWHHNKL